MSPIGVRRYRAERLLRREFQAMRGRVLASVRARLRAAGVRLDPADLEACYAQAWHGLYTAMLEGHSAGGAEIANPEGWLALVTYRRAIDEHRSRVRAGTGMGVGVGTGVGVGAGAGRADGGAHERDFDPGAPERDLASELDDRARLRQLMEGLRGRLAPRERQAAALCYLQGLSRADAAARMGISEARMCKLMDGSRPGTPGVAAKVGALLDTIRAGAYCAEQDSLMRGFAFGILDPGGERYALALAHQRGCPACRAHVRSLRGLAAVLPPLPLPLILGAGAGAGVGVAGAGGVAGGAGGAGAGAGAAGAGSAAGGMGSGVGAGSGVGSGVGAGSGMGAGVGTGAAAGLSGAGVGAGAGGGWLLAGGGLGAKLAVGCLVAVGVGASCVALSVGPIVLGRAPASHHYVLDGPSARARDARAYEALSATSPGAELGYTAAPGLGAGAGASTQTASAGSPASSALTQAQKASREFGPEQPPHGGTAPAQSGSAPHVTRTARSARAGKSAATGSAGGESAGSPTAPSGAAPGGSSGAGASGGSSEGSAGHESGSPSSAAREFGLG